MTTEQGYAPQAKNKRNMLPLVAIILVLFAFLGYSLINYAEKQVRENLLKELAPLQLACTDKKGCLDVPPNWVQRECPDNRDLPSAKICASPPSSSPYSSLIYRATSDSFVARWSYVNDLELIVRGGKDKELVIEERRLEVD